MKVVAEGDTARYTALTPQDGLQPGDSVQVVALAGSGAWVRRALAAQESEAGAADMHLVWLDDLEHCDPHSGG